MRKFTHSPLYQDAESLLLIIGQLCKMEVNDLELDFDQLALAKKLVERVRKHVEDLPATYGVTDDSSG